VPSRHQRKGAARRRPAGRAARRAARADGAHWPARSSSRAERTGYWPSSWRSARTRRTGRLENIAELEGRGGDLRGISPSSWRPWPSWRTREYRRRRHPVSLMTLPHREGTRVSPRSLRRARRRDLSRTSAHSANQRRLEEDAASATSDHEGSALPLPEPCLGPLLVGHHAAQHPEPVPRRDPRGARAATSGWWHPAARGWGHLERTALAAQRLRRPSGGAVARRATAGAEGSTGAEDLGLVAATSWCTNAGVRARC